MFVPLADPREGKTEDQLFAEYEKLIWFYCRRYEFLLTWCGIELEDAFASSSIKALCAIRSFDPAYGCELKAYISYVVINGLKSICRNARNPKRSLFKSVSWEEIMQEGSSATLGCLAQTNDDLTQVQVDEFVHRLSEKEQVIVHQRLQGCTQREIGDCFGVAQAAISRRMKRIREKYGSFL